MNKKRRKSLEEAITHLETAKDLIDEVIDEEQCAYDNLPPGFMDSETGEAMLENVADLESVDLSEAIVTIQEVIDR